MDLDADDDGNIDRSDHYTFAADGTRSLTRTAFDPDGDGTADRIDHYTYDDDGARRVIRRDVDMDDDGTINRTAHLNAEGRWERVDLDGDDDGNIDRIDHYRFDDDGNRSLTRTAFDDDGDGTADRSEVYSYNGDGTLIRTAFDDDADGRIDRTAFDPDGDRTADRIDHYTYDDDGARRVTRRDVDLDDDGTINRTAHLNAEGRWERVDLDADDDGNIDRSDHYTFAADGTRSLIRSEFDTDGDGNISRIAHLNADGRWERVEEDVDDDGTIDRIDHYAFAADGTRSLTRSESYSYDASGNRTRTAFDDDADGTADRSEAYSYGANGRVSRTDFDDDGDGTIDRSERVLSTLDGSNGFILTGIDAFDQSGISVSSAGDVNGDGYDDLIIGARYADPNGDSNAGETYLVYGGASAPGTDGVLDLSALNGTNGFTLTGIDSYDLSGFSVSSAGDVNGDGYDDLIIGAQGADPNGRNSGETYIVYGGANAPGTGSRFNLSSLNGSNGFTLNGIDAYDRSGASVSSAGDVNGDGYDDLIVGASREADPNGDDSGETYLVYGGASAPGTGGVLDLSDLDGTNGFIVNGIDARDFSGQSVSSAGDVNGDGYDDLIIGAPGADPNGDREAGETYIVYGGATGTESLVPVTAQGTAAAAAADNFTGNAGADSFTDIATNDVVRGGAGDDTISVTALDFAAIDGGTGRDTLILDGAGLSLDLTGAGHAGVDSVEVFDLSGTGGNTLVLDALAVFDLTEDRADGVASLDVRGGADDRVDLGGGSFALAGTVTEDGTTYNVYRDGNAQLRVEDGVSVTLAATPAGSMGTGTGFGAGANGDGDPERIDDRDASGLSVRLDEDTDGDGDTDRVTYEGDTDFAGNFPNNIGLEVVRLDGLDGDGSTDLTIPDEFVFAGNGEPATPVRIEGGSTDTLRFDMDDFAEAPETVGFGGESYRSFASDDQTWSFLVDADVMLFDI